MAHFAKISETNEVLNVVVIDNSNMLNADGIQNETVGKQYLETTDNWPAALWIQTSYNTLLGKHFTTERLESEDQSKALRGNFAVMGSIWDAENNIFLPQKPFPSWIKNVSEARWQSPIGDPPEITEEQTMCFYDWNEETQSWIFVDIKL